MINILQEIEAFKRDNGFLASLFNVTKRVVEEAFIRRVAKLNLPLMLKGSYITRQYLPENLKQYRIPADLDWVGLGKLEEQKLTKWMIAATTCQLADGLYFRDFRENAFFRDIDYAMADDFPTVSTDLLVYLSKECDKAQSHEIYCMDISFNLELALEPVSLWYQPLIGEGFTVPYSCPLDIQIAWKLHQTMVRPRFKDLVDLIWLLDSNPSINWDIVWQSIEAECKKDNTSINNIWRLKYLLNSQLNAHPVFQKNNKKQLKNDWQFWRNTSTEQRLKLFDWREYMLTSFREDSPIPKELMELLASLNDVLNQSGFTAYMQDKKII